MYPFGIICAILSHMEVNNMSYKFGTRLHECRKKKNLTQQQLADLVQTNNNITLSRITIARYEAGTREPDVSVLLALSDALNVPPSFLLGTSDFASTEIGNEYLKKFVENVEKHMANRGTSSCINTFLDRLNKLIEDNDILLLDESFIEMFSLLCDAILLNLFFPIPGNLDALSTHLNKMINDSNTEKQRDLINNSFSKFNVSYTHSSHDEINEDSAVAALGKAMVEVLTDFYTKHPNDPVPDNLKTIVSQILSKHNCS
ncbi:MAG: helix-turn-helix transcriptional regulator [Cellulosilyticum sp.]|nr:helix-turn-helix transcriptional regulator [Cellulosilyticum sp.]